MIYECTRAVSSGRPTCDSTARAQGTAHARTAEPPTRDSTHALPRTHSALRERRPRDAATLMAAHRDAADP
eukprot:1443444-Prymnesium_polylepis.2